MEASIEILVDDVLVHIFHLGADPDPFILIPYAAIKDEKIEEVYKKSGNVEDLIDGVKALRKGEKDIVLETRARLISKQKYDVIMDEGFDPEIADEGEEEDYKNIFKMRRESFVHPAVLMRVSKRWNRLVKDARDLWRFYVGYPEMRMPDYGDEGFCTWSNKMILDIPLPVPVRVVEFGCCFSYDAHASNVDHIYLASFTSPDFCMYELPKAQELSKPSAEYMPQIISKMRIEGLQKPIKAEDWRCWTVGNVYETFGGESGGFYNYSLQEYYVDDEEIRNLVDPSKFPKNMKDVFENVSRGSATNKITFKQPLFAPKSSSLGLSFEYPNCEVDFNAEKPVMFPRIPWFDGNIIGEWLDEGIRKGDNDDFRNHYVLNVYHSDLYSGRISDPSNAKLERKVMMERFMGEIPDLYFLCEVVFDSQDS